MHMELGDGGWGMGAGTGSWELGGLKETPQYK